MARASKIKVEPVVDLAALVSTAREVLARQGFVKLTAIGARAARPLVVAELASLGFEATRSLVRRPLAAQLTDALAQGAFIPLKTIASFVAGGTAAEAKAAATALIGGGHAWKALRGAAEVLVPSNAPVLTPEELRAARRVVDALSKELAKVSKSPGATVLRADLDQRLAEAFPDLGSRRPHALSAPVPSASGHPQGTRSDDLLERVLAAVDAARDEKMGLSFIPRVMGFLTPTLAVGVVHTALVSAADRGLIELRPEGGLNRLTPGELALCLPGPQGTRLSWARRVEARAP